MSDLVTQVADRQAITDQIYRYCRAMDRIDHELGYSIWHEDGTADYGHNYQGTGRGFIDHVCAQHAGLQQHSHQVSNIIIELDGEKAGGEAYVTATLRMGAGWQNTADDRDQPLCRYMVQAERALGARSPDCCDGNG